MGGARDRHGRRLARIRALSAILGLGAVAPAIEAAAQTAAAQPPPAAVAASAGAQSPSAAAAPATAPCELHVWPAAAAHTTFQGWVRAGAVDGAQRGVKGYPDQHANALDTGQQVRLLATVDWRGAFNDPALVVVIHPGPTGSDDDRSRTGRLATGSAACYRELIIVSSIVESEVFSSHSVRVLALRKRFDGASAAPVNFSSMSATTIAFTDADKAAADSAARMDQAVQAAFVSAVGKFATMQSFH